MSVPSPPVIYPQGAGLLNQIQFWWQAPVSDGGSPILYYTLNCPALSYSTQFSNSTLNTIVSVANSIDYYFNITATNANGTSDPAYFNRVSAGYAPNSISSISFTIISSYSGRVDWSYSSITNQQVLHSFLLYATPSTVGVSTLRFPIHPWVSSYNVYGYTSSYSFRVLPIGTGALWADSVPSTSVISMGKPPDPITGLGVGTKTESTLSISWGGGTGALSYIFTVTPDDGSPPFTITPNTLIGTTATFTGCNTWQNYNNGPLYTITVTAVGGSGTTDSSGLSVRFGPIPASSLTFSSVTTSSFTLLWQGANSASSFKFSLDSGSTFVYNSWTPNPYGSNTAGSSVFSGLGIGSTFSGVVAYAVNGASTISVPSKLPYSTLSLIPGAVTGLSVSSISQSSFTLNWSGATGASTIVYSGSVQPTTTNGIVGPAIFTGLTAGAYYSTIVIPTNKSGSSGIAASTLLKTAVAAVTGIIQSSGTYSTLNVSWSGALGAEYYKYIIDGVLSAAAISSSVSSVTISSLTANTAYSTAIVAYDTTWNNAIVSTVSNYVNLTSGPPIPNLAVSSLTLSSFTLIWTQTGGVTYALSGSLSQSNVTSPLTVSSITTNSTFTYTLTGSNAYGVSPSTFVVSSGPTQPNSFVYSSITTTSFTVTWSGGNGATSYTYSLNGTPTTPSTDNGVASKLASFTGLSGGSTYTIVVTAVNTSGSNSSASSSVSTVPTQPVSLAYSTITTSSFTVTWSGGNGATSYTYSLNGITTTPSTDNGVSSKLASFTGLSGGSTYTIVVTAVNSGGSNSSANSSVSTVPTQPDSLVFSSITASVFRVTWSGGIGATSYTYSLNGTPTTPSTDNGVASKTAIFTSLSANTPYTVIVTAVNSGGPNSSASSSVTTGPGAPSSLSTNATTISSFAVYWSGATGASSLTFHYGPSTITTPASQTSPYTISSLTAGSTYTVYIDATNSIANTSSNNLSVTTLPDVASNISISSITSNSFAVYWSGAAGASSLTIYYGPSTITIPASQSSPYTVTGLAMQTTYNVYIVTNSLGGTTSSNSITVSTIVGFTGAFTILFNDVSAYTYPPFYAYSLNGTDNWKSTLFLSGQTVSTTAMSLATDNKSKYVIAIQNDPIGLWYSTDAVVWSPVGSSLNKTHLGTSGMVYGNGVWVLASHEPAYSYASTDGINWTLNSYTFSGRVVFLNNKFFRASYNDSLVYYSINGTTWTSCTPGTVSGMYGPSIFSGAWDSVTNTYLLLMSYNNNDATSVWRSTDGITWTAGYTFSTATSGQSAVGNSLCWAFGKLWLQLHFPGTPRYSTNLGVSWTIPTMVGPVFDGSQGTTGYGRGISYNGSVMIMSLGQTTNGPIFYSSDGSNWTPMSSANQLWNSSSRSLPPRYMIQGIPIAPTSSIPPAVTALSTSAINIDSFDLYWTGTYGQASSLTFCYGTSSFTMSGTQLQPVTFSTLTTATTYPVWIVANGTGGSTSSISINVSTLSGIYTFLGASGFYGGNGTVPMMYSLDGFKKWGTAIFPGRTLTDVANNNWRRVYAYGGGKHIVALSSDYYGLYSSTDGIAWSPISKASTLFPSAVYVTNGIPQLPRYMGLVYANGIWLITVLRYDDSQLPNTNIYRSTDNGITWTQVTGQTYGVPTTLLFIRDKFFAMNRYQFNLYYSTDGLTWSGTTLANPQMECQEGLWDSSTNRYIIKFSDQSNNGSIYYSTDAINWTLSLPATQYWLMGLFNAYGKIWTANQLTRIFYSSTNGGSSWVSTTSISIGNGGAISGCTFNGKYIVVTVQGSEGSGGVPPGPIWYSGSDLKFLPITQANTLLAANAGVPLAGGAKISLQQGAALGPVETVNLTPNAITGLSTLATEVNSISLYWAGATWASSLVFYYGTSSITTQAQGWPYTISSLTLNTSYTIYMDAYGSGGGSVRSDSITATTQNWNQTTSFTLISMKSSSPYIVFSVDGISNWSSVNLPGASGGFSSNNPFYIASSPTKTLGFFNLDTNGVYSMNRSTYVWTNIGNGNPNALFPGAPNNAFTCSGPAYGNNIWFVPIQDRNTYWWYLYKSIDDGVTWTSVSSSGKPWASNQTPNRIFFIKDTFFATHNDTRKEFFKSTDGTTWTSLSPAIPIGMDFPPLNLGTYDTVSNRYIIPIMNTNSLGGNIWYSGDGTNWTGVTVGASNYQIYSPPVYAFGKWYVFSGAFGGQPTLYSATNTAGPWTLVTTTGLPSGYARVFKFNGTYIIMNVENSAGSWYYSSDGTNFSALTSLNSLLSGNPLNYAQLIY